jgi:hypothetical protein
MLESDLTECNVREGGEVMIFMISLQLRGVDGACNVPKYIPSVNQDLEPCRFKLKPWIKLQISRLSLTI